MNLTLFSKNKSGMTALTGFKQVRPALNSAGNERFGLVEIAPEYAAGVFPYAETSRKRPPVALVGALRLSGPAFNRWLNEEKDDRAFFVRLCQALPDDSPAQFLLRRRRGQLQAHYQEWQQQAQRRLRDPEIASFFAQDYLESVIYPIEDNGLADLWSGVLIAGRSEEELAGRMAWLVANLPGEATPCSASELSALLLDYFAPDRLEAEREQASPLPESLYADWLSENPPEIYPNSLLNGYSNAYWMLSAPPLRSEGGWTRALLANETLADCEFDITVHLFPAHQEDTMREILERRVLTLDAEIEAARQARREASLEELSEKRQEVEAHLTALIEGQERYFATGVTLALRSLPENFEEECAAFEDELRECGLSPQRASTAYQVQAAMLDCAPLNLSQLERPFVLPAAEAGRLAQLGAVGQPSISSNAPLAGMSPAGEPVHFNPAARPGQAAQFLLGEPGKASARSARGVVRYLAAMRSVEGGAIYGFDFQGDWRSMVEQLEGRYVAFGPHETQYNFNPLEISAANLGQISGLESWVSEMGGFLSALLELEDERREELSAVLLSAAIEQSRRNQPLSAASLWIQAEVGGYSRLALELKSLCQGGRYGWLFGRPTRLPLPGSEPFIFVGLSPEIRDNWNEKARRYYFTRLFDRFSTLARVNIPTSRYLLLVDQAQELIADPVALRTLAGLGLDAAKLGLSMWLLSPSSDDWQNSHLSRGLLERAQTQLFFNQNGSGLSGLARRLNLSQRFIRAVRETVPGAAIVRQLDEDGDATLFAFEGLPADYIERLSGPVSQLGFADNSPTTTKAKPLEVPLFATEEIWGDSEFDRLNSEDEFGPDDETEPEIVPAVAYAYA